jgi:type IV secretion/conjugal transfer VirB4 family ATPase
MKTPALKLPFIKPLKEYATKTRAFSDLLPYAVKLDSKTILNKDGSLMATYTYRGGDMGSESQLNMADLNRRINDAIKRFGVGWMFHFSCERKQAQGYPKGSFFKDATSAIIDQIRELSFEKEGQHYINEYWLDITYLPPADSTRRGEEFLIEGQRELGPEHAAKETLKQFNEQLTMLEGMVGSDLQLRRVGVTPIEDEHGVVEVDEQISHLIKCTMNRDILLQKIDPQTDVSTVVGCTPLRGGFRLRMDDMLCSVLIVTDMPGESHAGMFDVLNRIEAHYRASWRFIVRDQAAALKDIELERGKWHGKRRSAADALQQKETRFENSDAVKMANDANDAAGLCRSGDAVFGYFTMSIVFWQKIEQLDEAGEGEEEAWTKLRKQQDTVASYIHRIHFQTYHEQENVVEAFLGTLPGMGSAQLRKPMLSSRNLADFIPTTAVWTGSPTNPCQFYPADSPPLAYVSTNGCTPFSLNIHAGDVGHFLVTGDTGGGKSVLLGFLLAQHRRYPEARQIVFDVGRSHYTLCQAVGGLHYEIGGDSGVAFCPLAHIDEPQERAWAEQWIGLLVEKRGIVNAVEARKPIVKALENMARNGPPYSLSNLMRQPYLEPGIVDSIRHYTVEGNSNGILDAEYDSLNNSDFIVFEMQGLMDADPSIREPALLFLFHYIERLCTGRPTLFILEEVWTFLDNPQAAQFIKRWLKTLRKMNVAVGFANQSLGEFTKSSIADTIIGSCITKILLANPNASTSQQREAYEKIGLTSWQRKQVAAARRKREYYFVSDLGKRMIKLDLSAVELAFLGISNKDEVDRVRQIVEEENALLAEYGPLPLDKHIPWQARWIAERVGKEINPEVGQAWAMAWIDAWKQRGGYNLDRIPQLSSPERELVPSL